MVQFTDLWYRHPAHLATSSPCVAPEALTNLEGRAIAPLQARAAPNAADTFRKCRRSMVGMAAPPPLRIAMNDARRR